MLLAWAIINCRVRLRPPAGTRCSWIASSGDSPRAPGISTVLSSFGSFGGVSFLMSHLCGGSLEITGFLEAQYLQSMTIRGWVKEHGLLWLPLSLTSPPEQLSALHCEMEPEGSGMGSFLSYSSRLLLKRIPRPFPSFFTPPFSMLRVSVSREVQDSLYAASALGDHVAPCF